MISHMYGSYLESKLTKDVRDVGVKYCTKCLKYIYAYGDLYIKPSSSPKRGDLDKRIADQIYSAAVHGHGKFL